MSGAIGAGLRVDPRAVDEIERLLAHRRDQRGRSLEIVGVVAVDHDVDVGVDVGEHAPDHVALALATLGGDDRARRARDASPYRRFELLS